MQIEVAAQHHCQTGEGPVWHPTEGRLYWTDIPRGRLYWFDPATGASDVCYEDRLVGGFTVQADGSLLLFRDRGNVVAWRDGRVQRTVLDSIPGLEETRFNDVIADPEGRVFVGTMSHGGPTARNGRLYRIARDGSYTLISEGHGTPNGMGFTPDLRQMYFTDSRLARIYRYDYDRATGNLANEQIFTETPKDLQAEIGRGDGMTVDAEGNVWSGRWGGSHIVVFSPSGDIVRRIPMPAKNISCVNVRRAKPRRALCNVSRWRRQDRQRRGGGGPVPYPRARRQRPARVPLSHQHLTEFNP